MTVRKTKPFGWIEDIVDWGNAQGLVELAQRVKDTGWLRATEGTCGDDNAFKGRESGGTLATVAQAKRCRCTHRTHGLNCPEGPYSHLRS